MIKKINSMSGFGVFREFRWPENLPPFARLNLIYGWNYSGKTTLSRVFQAMEQQKLPDAYPNARFSVSLESGLQIFSADLSGSPAVRVFNRDYVEANFEAEHVAQSIFLLGEENIALSRRLEQLKRRAARMERIIKRLQKDQKAIQEDLDRSGTAKAREVRELLGDPKFRRPELEKRVEEVKESPDLYILREQHLLAKASTLRSQERFSRVDGIPAELPDIAKLVGEVNELVAQTASQRAIERLAQNWELESWVREGLRLHQDTCTCEFCGGPLTSLRLEELRGHFSQQYENLAAQIDDRLASIDQLNLNPPVPDEKYILPEFRENFSQLRGQLADWSRWAGEVCADLVQVLRQKQKMMERQFRWEGDLQRAGQGLQLVNRLNELIGQHNATVAHTNKEDLRTAIERHYAAVHYKEIAPKRVRLEKRRRRINWARRILRNLEEETSAIEQKTEQAAIGAERLNRLLQYLLPGGTVQVVHSAENKFQFQRNGHVARHLSDGERTAITFAYFLTSLEGTNIEDTIVFIDDPVSSLDSNHIYAIHALIEERLEKSKQLFVATHNSELFNLLKRSWLDHAHDYRNKGDTGAYLIWRFIDDGAKPTAGIYNLPPLLRRFQSEYEFVFSQLYKFAHAATPSLNGAYLAPNLLRKLLEAYLGFRKPNIGSWSKKLDLLFDLPSERLEIKKFVDDGSHLHSLGRALQHPSFADHAQRCVKAVLAAMKEKDREHYESLCAAMQDEAGARRR